MSGDKDDWMRMSHLLYDITGTSGGLPSGSFGRQKQLEESPTRSVRHGH
jgi:hypothetical protein